jgi:hypothetical protein
MVYKHIGGQIVPHIDQRELYSAAMGITIGDFQREVAKSEIPAGVDPRPVILNPIWEILVSAQIWVHVGIAELNADDPFQRAIIEDGRFELRIVGDCMEPAYPNGSMARFRLMRSDLEAIPVDRAYVFCRDDGTATFKALVALHGEGDDAEFELAAANQNQYPGTFRVRCREIQRIARAFGVVQGEPDLHLKIKRPKAKGKS